MSSPLSAIVIGGGPAGLSAGIGLMRSGYATTILEQRVKWTGRVCGSFLNPESVHHLKWLGLEKECRGRAPLVFRSAITYQSRTLSYAPIQQNGMSGLALPRHELETLLTNQFLKEGGTFQTGARVISLSKENTSWKTRISTGAEFSSDILVWADGRYSINNEDLRSQMSDTDGWYGWNAAFSGLNQKPGEMGLHLIPGGYVGVLTFADLTTNVCGLVQRKEGESKQGEDIFKEAIHSNRVFRDLMQQGQRETNWQGVGPLPFCSSIRESKGAFMVGDAAAVGDPFMGEGIGRALSAGPMLFDALKTDTPLAIYQQRWKIAFERRLRMSAWMRQTLRNSFALPITAKLLYRNSWFIKVATRRFHVGYNASSQNPNLAKAL